MYRASVVFGVWEFQEGTDVVEMLSRKCVDRTARLSKGDFIVCKSPEEVNCRTAMADIGWGQTAC